MVTAKMCIDASPDFTSVLTSGRTIRATVLPLVIGADAANTHTGSEFCPSARLRYVMYSATPGSVADLQPPCQSGEPIWNGSLVPSVYRTVPVPVAGP